MECLLVVEMRDSETQKEEEDGTLVETPAEEDKTQHHADKPLSPSLVKFEMFLLMDRSNIGIFGNELKRSNPHLHKFQFVPKSPHFQNLNRSLVRIFVIFETYWKFWGKAKTVSKVPSPIKTKISINRRNPNMNPKIPVHSHKHFCAVNHYKIECLCDCFLVFKLIRELIS